MINEQETVTGQSVTSLSVFALGTIPALINLGYILGDLVNVEVYQKKRNNYWDWDSDISAPFSEDYYKKELPATYSDELAVNVSLSGDITQEKIVKTIGWEIPIYKITIEQPNLDFLHTKSQFEHFERHWNLFLTEVRERNVKKLHIFSAVPCSIAVLIGRATHKKIDPEIYIYDLNMSGESYLLKWTINGKSETI